MSLQRPGVADQNASGNKRKGSPCQQDGDGDSQGVKIIRCSIPDLPEDIWHHIHSLMPLHDAARAACLSRTFLRSWRCYPNLTLDVYTLASEAHTCKRSYNDTIDCILRNRSGSLKVLELCLEGLSCRYLDRWLHAAVTPGIEKLTLEPFKQKYNVPCSLFSDGVRNSIRYLKFHFCTFRPTAELAPLRSLTSLHLHSVNITGDELECLLCNTLALEQLVLINCNEIVNLKIPCVLQHLGYLKIFGWRCKVIENKAPNLSSFWLSTWSLSIPEISLGETLRMKNLTLHSSNVAHYTRAKLPCIVPNLETLDLSSDKEVVSTPMLPSKFLCLKHLSISLTSLSNFSRSFDYFSLVSFLDASPSLETLTLDVTQERMKHVSVVGGPSHLRQMPEHRYCCLKSVKIKGFSSAKGLVELACHILKNAISLGAMTLDTIFGDRCSEENGTICTPMSIGFLTEALRAVTAIRHYIEDKVPPTVQLTVMEPCRSVTSAMNVKMKLCGKASMGRGRLEMKAWSESTVPLLQTVEDFFFLSLWL